MTTKEHKAPTIAQTLRIIRRMGLTATYSWDWREFTINFKREDARRTAESDYKTESRIDAIDTAHAMTKQGISHPIKENAQ